jgi:polyketide biosynthesis enoyl-CoA hydratase PksI
LCQELEQLLDQLARDDSTKVVILRGRPDVFSSGAPREILEGIFQGQLDVKDVELPRRLLAFPRPIIAALEGSAAGGGLTMAMCCDITVAAENQRYGVNFASMGFTPAMGTTGLLPLLVGRDFALEMMLTAKFYKGRELAGRGLFTHIVPAKEVYPLARDIASRIAEKELTVISMIKDTLATPRLAALQEVMSREHLMHKICFARPETRAIIEKNYLG